MNEIIVVVHSLDIWWSIYGIAESTIEDIDLYLTKNDGSENELIAETEIITQKHFLDLKESGSTEELEMELMPFEVDTLEELVKDNEIKFGYYFDEEENEENQDDEEIPAYISIYHPSKTGIDINVIEESIKKYCSEIFQLEVNKVTMGDPVTREEALLEYQQYKATLNN